MKSELEIRLIRNEFAKLNQLAERKKMRLIYKVFEQISLLANSVTRLGYF